MPSRRPVVFRAAAVCLALFGPPATAAAQHAGHNVAITVPAGAPYTVADVEFMQGMIAHHAQAIHMSRMAEKHGANPRVLRLATKIDQSQVAEIRLMQEWLVDYGQVAPDTSSWRTMKMAGMLTDAQLAELDAATGVAFDRLFLTFMILHHEGALQMVKDLFATPRAGQEVDVNVFANDVVTVQTAEIGIMQQLLSQLPPLEPRVRVVPPGYRATFPLPHVLHHVSRPKGPRPHRRPHRSHGARGADLSEQ